MSFSPISYWLCCIRKAYKGYISGQRGSETYDDYYDCTWSGYPVHCFFIKIQSKD